MSDTGVLPRMTGQSRSSTALAKYVLASAAATHDARLAESITGIEDWRWQYPSAFVGLTALEASRPDVALDVARAGLGAAVEGVRFRHGGRDLPVTAALEVREPRLATVEVAGTRPRAEELVVPYRGRDLRGEALERQLEDWVERGIAEPGFRDAVAAVVRHPEWLDLSGRSFALLGAGSELGPLRPLLSWGATVAAVDLPRPAAWERMAERARAGSGRLLAPTRDPAAGIRSCGADILVEPGPISAWLAALPGPLTLGSYGYADGVLFLRLAVASDLIAGTLLEQRDDVSLALLATPADAFVVPMSAVEKARGRDSLHPANPLAWPAHALRALSGGRLVRANYSDNVIDTSWGRYGLLDAFVVEQGPNYALAKRLQRWRMEVARSEGALTSVHIAPPTRTASVLHNPRMALQQRRTAHLGIETFDPETVRALAAAVLVRDLRDPDAPGNPQSPLAHPHAIYLDTANPGGRWAIPWDLASTLALFDAAAQLRDRGTEPLRRAVGRLAGRG